MNWQPPLVSYQVIVNLIGNTTQARCEYRQTSHHVYPTK